MNGPVFSDQATVSGDALRWQESKRKAFLFTCRRAKCIHASTQTIWTIVDFASAAGLSMENHNNSEYRLTVSTSL